MSSTLCISIRFIQPHPLFHGRRDGAEPEWPPSPMRAFQALLNAACLRERGKPLPAAVRNALQALETLRPLIVAPRATLASAGHRSYVPHNQGDLVTAAWHRGNLEASLASYRIEKDFRPHRIEFVDDELPTVHYLYSLADVSAKPTAVLNALRPSVRSIHCLGWGIDQVIADASIIEHAPDLLNGEKWMPAQRGGRRLRVHQQGSLDALMLRHERFLSRLTDGNWSPVPPLIATDYVGYRRDTDPVGRPYAVFKLLDDNEDPARYPHAKLMHIAGMVRHVAIVAMRNDSPPWVNQEDQPEWVNRTVRGKRDDSAGREHDQFSYVPLPSIGHAHADAIIRNVMLVAPHGMERELEFLATRIDGRALQPEGVLDDSLSDGIPGDEYRAELRRFTPPPEKFVAKCYLPTSRIWQSVTPVILPGHNDKKDDKTRDLIQRTLRQAGIDIPCEFTWQSVPFFKNCLSAHKYDRERRHTGYYRPNHLHSQTAMHIRLLFTHPMPGPLIIGAGRHCGFGLMAAVEE